MADGDASVRRKGNETLLSVVVAVAVLYLARVVFIPLALAVLLAFLLGPLVIRLRRWRFGSLAVDITGAIRRRLQEPIQRRAIPGRRFRATHSWLAAQRRIKQD